MTLGVLTILSVMVVSFLLTARHQSLSSKHFHDKTVARQALDVALVRAMQFADGAMIASNYTDSSAISSPADSQLRRVFPVGRWYGKAYDTGNKLSSQIDYQSQDVLLVPITNNTSSFQTNAVTVNLLTDEVRRLLPSALINRLGSTANPLLSGWITDFNGGLRVSFAVLNCSGFPDAHTYDFNSDCLSLATQSYARAYFNQQDLINSRSEASPSPKKTEDLAHLATLSYDPSPYTIPFAPHSSSVNPRLGFRDFSITNKFNINTLTNYFSRSATASSDPNCSRIRVTQKFENKWLAVVSNSLNDAQLGTAGVVLGDSGKVAWNIAAYMTPSRVPQISFPGIALATREDYGVESVPLINEVAVFNCFDKDGRCDGIFDTAISKIKQDTWNRINQELQALFPDEHPTLAQIDSVSNVYAAAAELWYPFVPRPIVDETRRNESMRLYLGVYTNKGDVVTTVNKQWSAGDLADWYGLDDPTVAELEATILNDDYENSYTSFTNTLFWTLVETNRIVVAVIQEPDTLTDANLLPFSTGLANGYVGVYTDFETGLIATNNPYLSLLYHYAPADTNMTPEAAALYYVTASNYIPVLVTVLTSRVETVVGYDGGGFVYGLQSVSQRHLPPIKIQIGAFGQKRLWTPEDYGGHPLCSEDFNAHGFCAITNNKDLVCFPVLSGNSAEKSYHVDFLSLGGENRKCWVRPVVAVKEPGNFGLDENDGYEAVDEALLTGKGETAADKISVIEWPQANEISVLDQRIWSLSVADPRDNAWQSDTDGKVLWYPAAPTFGAVNGHPAAEAGAGTPADEGKGYSDAIPGVAELPLVHADSPLRSVGELGYVTADLEYKAYNRDRHARDKGGNQVVRDTIDFSTPVGASLLDRFTVSSTNCPMRGLVQANTPYPNVIRKLIENTPYGWTNTFAQTEHLFQLSDGQGLSEMIKDWTNTLFRTAEYGYPDDGALNGRPGWRCFADMLPDLATNAIHTAENALSKQETDPFYRHDYIEDVMRGIVDKVSFRQNIYVVIVAAQTLSPASTEANPIVLADQRAAVTVIRDAYTGRWLIHSWVWLTE